MKLALVSLAFAALAAPMLWPHAALHAQERRATPPAPSGTVSGRVFCADTNTPARMANVVLLPADQIEHMASGEQDKMSFEGEMAETLLDGSFTIAHVTPGVYYVIATAPGYVSPLTSLYEPSHAPLPAAGAGVKKREISAPRVTVQPNLPTSVTVSIERGAAVSGTVLYDDGSPAQGIRITVLVRSKDDWTRLPSNPVGSQSYSAGTDDQGRYRISGLPAGEYILQASIDLTRQVYKISQHSGTSMTMSTLYDFSFYSGGTARRKDAKPITVSTGDEIGGQDIEIPLSRLHTVRGSIVAAHDGHVLNGGEVALLYADDHSRVAGTSISQDDNTFSFPFVPEGDYILEAKGVDNEYTEIQSPAGRWPPSHTETKLLRSYATADQPIHISGDVIGITISAPDAPSQSRAN